MPHKNPRLRIIAFAAVLLAAGFLYLQHDHRQEAASHTVTEKMVEHASRKPVSTQKLQSYAIEERLTGSTTVEDHDRQQLQLIFRNVNILLNVERNNDGRESARLGGQHRSVSAARRLPDGRIETSCFVDYESLYDFLYQPADTSSPSPSITKAFK
ncbi:hypothetical protein [Coraliomargarita parva]|uniref:hypothetical protein n=1 Tax=Coraliomargarita parva TaxID=3014050 RepID=UPI0022B2F1CE|nr:hypothetical protein [Coraliomargarita parva]